MITRKLGKLLRGSATPFQIMAAAVLASLIAFVPGFLQAPGLLICWIALLVVLNANLFLAGIVGIAAKLLALLLAPVSFAVGRLLLEGPTRGMFAALANAPVFAWFGFDYQSVTGGMFVGLVLGGATGAAMVVTLRRTWRRMASHMPSLLDGREGSIAHMVRAADGRSFWRLRTFGFESRDAAASFCDEVKAQGVDCFPTRS